jgi:hypothetical protein
MEVDSKADQDIIMDATVNELTELLVRIESEPDNVSLLQKQVRLMQQLGMTREAHDSLMKLSSLVMLDEGDKFASDEG